MQSIDRRLNRESPMGFNHHGASNRALHENDDQTNYSSQQCLSGLKARIELMELTQQPNNKKYTAKHNIKKLTGKTEKETVDMGLNP